MAETAQTKLKKALLALLDGNDFDQLSVSKICKEAGVHRSTFYAHYDNQIDLLENMQDYLTEMFNAFYLTYREELNAPKEQDTLVDSYHLIPYLQYIKDHQAIYKIYLKRPVDFNLEANDEGHIVDHFLKRYRERGIKDEKKIRYMSGFYMAGIRRIIYDWVLEGCQDDIAYIVNIIHTIIY